MVKDIRLKEDFSRGKVMRITFKEPTNVSEVQKFNNGIVPRYGRGTMKGVFWCPCGKCVGDILLLNNDNVVGWIDTECDCGYKIDWSQADKYA